MKSEPIVEQVTREEWIHEVPRFDDHNYRQSLNYGAACAMRQGANSEHVAIHCDHGLIGLAEVRTRRLPLLGSGIAYVGCGPLTRLDATNTGDRFGRCVRALREEYVLRRKLVLRILAPIGLPDWNAHISSLMVQAGMEHTCLSPPYRTMLVDLDRPISDIRQSFGRRWRRGLRQAECRGVQLRTANDVVSVEMFCELYEEMRARKRFEVDLDARFFGALLKQCPKEDGFELLLAERNGQFVAGIMTSTLGETCVYLHGASSEEGRQTRASYLLHWESMMAARRRGSRWYDVGGIDPAADSDGYVFKSGMGGIEVLAAGPFDASPSGLSGKMIRVAETTYRFSQGLRNRRTSSTQRTSIRSIASRSDS